jgi:hypothetical protein
VARRARLEVVVPTRQHRIKRLIILSARCVIVRTPLSTAGSTVLFAVHIGSAATSRQEFGAAMSRTQSADMRLQKE